MQFPWAVLLVLASAEALVGAGQIAPLPVNKARSAPPASRSGWWVNGLVAATFTAMNPDSSINLQAIPAQAASIEAQGISYVFVCGTTGESLSLTVDERMAIAEQWASVVEQYRLALIVHVGAESVSDAITLAQHAESLGAVAIAAIPPVFFPPSSNDNLIQFLSAIASAAPNTPFIYYHFPTKTNVLTTGIYQFVTAAAAAIPTFHGVKFTDYDLFDVGLITRYRDNDSNAFQVLFGKDEVMDAALLMGVTGFIGSTYNYAGELFNGIIQNFNSGNITAVQIGQANAQSFVEIFLSFSSNNVNAQKAIVYLKTGVDMGPPRLPMTQITSVNLAAMQLQLKQIGFFQWS